MNSLQHEKQTGMHITVHNHTTAEIASTLQNPISKEPAHQQHRQRFSSPVSNYPCHSRHHRYSSLQLLQYCACKNTDNSSRRRNDQNLKYTPSVVEDANLFALRNNEVPVRTRGKQGKVGGRILPSRINGGWQPEIIHVFIAIAVDVDNVNIVPSTNSRYYSVGARRRIV